MQMIKWTKPSGIVIETNDSPANVEYCVSMGWKADGLPSADEPETKAPEDMTVAELRAALIDAGEDPSAECKKAELILMLENVQSA